MPTLIERAREGLTNALLGEEKQKLEQTTRMLYDAYLEGPWVQTPEQLIQQLSEVDSSILTDMLLQLGWESYGLGYTLDSSAERQRAVKESRRMWKYSVVAIWEIGLWTSFGLGESIVIEPASNNPMSDEEDDDGNPLPLASTVWDEFWRADRNAPLLAEDKIHDKLSNWLLVDGERFLAFYGSSIDGECTVRKLPPEEITEIITDPDDAATPWWYKRVFSDTEKQNKEWYYPDWGLFFSDNLDRAAEVLPKGVIRADEIAANKDEIGASSGGTTVCVLHVPLPSRDESSLRGWPLLSPAGAPWIRAHKKFREDRAAVAARVAMFVDKLKHQGGSRAGTALALQMASTLSASNRMETNPPPAAGSTWVGNQALDLERMPLSSGAGDAKADGEAMLLMAGLAGGVYPHYLGAGDAYRLATAQSMERPLLMQWSRYRSFWSAQFRKMVKIVLKFYEQYNTGVEFDTYEAEVSTDQLVQTDADALTQAVSRFYRDVLVPQLDLGYVDVDAVKKITARVTRVVLQAIGVADADEVASDEAFKVGVEEESEEKPVPEETEMPDQEWPEEMARSVLERYKAGESPADAVADWALATLIEAGHL
jgi:hypothetical protein